MAVANSDGAEGSGTRTDCRSRPTAGDRRRRRDEIDGADLTIPAAAAVAATVQYVAAATAILPQAASAQATNQANQLGQGGHRNPGSSGRVSLVTLSRQAQARLLLQVHEPLDQAEVRRRGASTQH